MEKKVTLVPTLSIIKWFGEYEEKNGNQAAADRFYHNVEKHGEFVKAAWEAGVPIACGTDENGMHGTGPLPGGIRLPRQGGPAELCDPAGREQRRRENAGPSGQGRLARGGQIRGHSRPEQEPAGGHLDPAQQGKHCLRRAGRVRKGSVL